jgi:hypothetical protein
MPDELFVRVQSGGAALGEGEGELLIKLSFTGVN